MATPFPPYDVLILEEECTISGSDQRLRDSVESRVTEEPSECITATKKHVPRDVEEIASLQAQLATLTLQLKTIKQARLAGANALLLYGSYWRTEAKHQSKRRAEAQQENERLRSQLRDQKQFATRLVNMMKRRPSTRIMQTLNRYEQAAKVRDQKKNAEFDAAFIKTDAMLAAADLIGQRSTLFGIRRKQSGQRGFCIEFGQNLSLPCDLAVVSETIWHFRPHHDLHKHFVYDHVRALSFAQPQNPETEL